MRIKFAEHSFGIDFKGATKNKDKVNTIFRIFFFLLTLHQVLENKLWGTISWYPGTSLNYQKNLKLRN